MPRHSTIAGPQPLPVDPFFALSPDLFCITTLDGRFRRVNPAFIATLGHSEPELLATGIFELLHPADRPAAVTAIAALAHGNSIPGLESRFRCANGSYKFLAWSTTLFPAVGVAPTHASAALAYTVAHDRTSRRLGEEALRLSEARRVCALESTTDAFFAVDPGWRLIRVNRQAERLWTRRREDLLGRNLWEVFPAAAGGPFFRLFDQAMRTGDPAHLEEFYPCYPAQRWFEVHAYPSPDGLAVYFRDVTARRHADQQIKRAFEEKEVLLREVHHRVKNNLQVVCSLLRLQERTFHDAALTLALRDCRDRVHTMAMLHDQLHRAKDFSNINLGEYVRNLASSLFSSYGMNSANVDLRMEVEDIPVPVDTAIPCGLIVNELVSNSLRHAFPEGRKGRVSLGLHARSGGSVELTVADDGRGFPQSAQPLGARSLGLWLVDLLASQIGAVLQRSTAAGAQYRLLFVGQASLPVPEKEKLNE